jgi:hypothetical protein
MSSSDSRSVRIRGRLGIESEHPLPHETRADVTVAVDMDGAPALIIETGLARWRLDFEPGGAAYIAGLLAARSGVESAADSTESAAI